MVQRYYVIILFFSLVIYTQSLTAQRTTVFNEEKLSLALGLGVQYNYFGLQGKYFFSDHVAAIGGAGVVPLNGLLWNAGIELRLQEIRSKRVSPYLNILVGTNTFRTLDGFTISSNGFPMFFEEKVKFIGGIIGAGIKFDDFDNNRGYLKLGFDFLIVNPNHSKTIDEFNSRNMTSFSRSWPRFLPAIGYVYTFNYEEEK
jgi:hypothetical protein